MACKSLNTVKMTEEACSSQQLQFLPLKSSSGYRSNKSFRSPAAHKSLKLEEEMATSMKVLQLVDDSKFTMTQINGQRRLGPPPDWNGPAPSYECEVFVGKIPRTLYEHDIYPVFRRMGEIFEIRLMMDFSGTNRGYCFVMYTKPEYAARAVVQLDQFEIRPGKKIGVVASLNNCRLYIGRLPMHVSAQIIVRKIYEMTDDVDKVMVYRHPQSHMSYALVSYKTHRGAAMARKRLVPETSTFVSGTKINVEWAPPNMSPSNVYEECGTCDKDGKVKMKRRFIRSTEGTKSCGSRERKQQSPAYLNGQLHSIKGNSVANVAVASYHTEQQRSLLWNNCEQRNKEVMLCSSKPSILPVKYDQSSVRQSECNLFDLQISGEFPERKNSRELINLRQNGLIDDYVARLAQGSAMKDYSIGRNAQLQEIPQNKAIFQGPSTYATNAPFAIINNHTVRNENDYRMLYDLSINIEQKENEDPRNQGNTFERIGLSGSCSSFSVQPNETLYYYSGSMPLQAIQQNIKNVGSSRRVRPVGHRISPLATDEKKVFPQTHVSTSRILLDENSNQEKSRYRRPILSRFRDN